MTAKEFWTNFIDQVKEDEVKLKKAWCKETSFTNEIKETIRKAIKKKYSNAVDYKRYQSFGNGEYVLQTEYFNIDLVCWQQRKDKEYHEMSNEAYQFKKYKLKKHAWDFDIAIEHENKPMDWSDEVIKLAYIFCNLRVVIGYFPYMQNKKEKRRAQLAYLNTVAQTLNDLECKENMSHGDFIVILGDSKEYADDSTDFKELEYIPYKWNGSEFELLE